jgi:hypothetical protein
MIAAILAGATSWLVGQLTTISVGRNSLFFELTSGAAFTMLLIFLPASAALACGRLLFRRNSRPEDLEVGAHLETDYPPQREYDYLDEETTEHAYDRPTTSSSFTPPVNPVPTNEPHVERPHQA